MSVVQFAYQFSGSTIQPTEVVEPPSRIQFDALYPYVDVTRVWVPNVSSNGNNVRDYLLAIPTGARLLLQDSDDSTRSVEFVTTGPAVGLVDVVELPVAWVANDAELNSNQSVAFFVVSSAPAPKTGIVLVDFDVAKKHLRITDDDHNEEIQTKLEIASAEILDYLKNRGDPTWTPATAPLVVQGATLKLLGGRYEHRGDDSSTADNHESALWDEIGRMLARSRDPALA